MAMITYILSNNAFNLGCIWGWYTFSFFISSAWTPPPCSRSSTRCSRGRGSDVSCTDAFIALCFPFHVYWCLGATCVELESKLLLRQWAQLLDLPAWWHLSIIRLWGQSELSLARSRRDISKRFCKVEGVIKKMVVPLDLTACSGKLLWPLRTLFTPVNWVYSGERRSIFRSACLVNEIEGRIKASFWEYQQKYSSAHVEATSLVGARNDKIP